MSGTAPPRLVPDPASDDDADETRNPGARARPAGEDDRSASRHVFGAPLVLDRSD